MYYQYIKNREVFFCPNSANNYDSTLSEDELTEKVKVMNYSSNEEIMPERRTKPVKYTKIKTPSNIVILYDGLTAGMRIEWWSSRGNKNRYLPGWGKIYPKQTPNASLSDEQVDDYNNGRHNGGINLVYCDGHAEWKKCEEIVNWRNLTKQNPMLPKSW